MDQRSTFIEGKYEILGKIREGGMGAIYKVRHRLLDEIRVIKVMKPQVLADEDLRKRFVEEAKTATRLKHPNICTIHDFSLDPDGTAYLVMEFIDGVTLAELSKSSTPVSVAMTVEIALQSLLALGYLHRRNVVHRDIAPDNLMLTSDEEGAALVKLIDLGIAKALDRPTDLTSTGVFLGKLKYASPEQYGALAPGEKIDGRSDLYCLGLVLYELLTGARPFIGETPAEMIRAHIFQPPKPFEETDPDGRVPPELRAAVLKALEKKREDRFATAEDFHRELVRLKDEVPPAIDVDSTVQFVSNVRSTQQVTGIGVTPSAQGRLDRRFGAHSTPHPTRPPAQTGSASGDRKAPFASSGPDRPSGDATVATPSASAPPKSRRLFVLGAALLAVVAAAVFVVFRSAGRSPAAAAAPAAQVAARDSGNPTPAGSAASVASTAVSTPAEVPAAIATAPPASTDAVSAAAPAVSTPVPAPLRPSPTPRGGAGAKPKPTEPPPRRPSPVQVARNVEPAVVPTRVPAAVPPALPTAAPDVPAARPTPVPAPAAATAAPGGEPADPRASGAADQDKIREVLRDYERAHNTLDVDLYARVFPSLVSQQRQNLDRAWLGLKSQHLEVEVRRIEVKGSQAVVHAVQRLNVVPQAGEAQHDSREVVLRMEKRGDGWIITGRT